MRQSLVIIGNGMAPGRMLEYLLEKEKQHSARFAYDITIFNAEPRVNYNRLMLSPVLSGDKSYQDIITHGDDWYERHNITLYKGDPVDSIDANEKTVTSSKGLCIPYDKLVIATGSVPNKLKVPGSTVPGVQVYRDLDDVEQMLDYAREAQHSGRTPKAVVIGGGLLGLEAAAGLSEQGIGVTVVHFAQTLMEKQLDPSAGYLLEKEFKSRDIDVITGATTTEIVAGDHGHVDHVQLSDGTSLPAELVVMAIGIRPSVELAEKTGLMVNRGIVVNDRMQTSQEDIYALGECVEHRDRVYGLVAPLYEMAKVLARVLADELDPAAGENKNTYSGSVTSTKLKVNGIDLYSAGEFSVAADRSEIVLRDASAGIYKRLVLEDNRIVGVVLYGETSDGAWFFDLLKKQTDISQMRDTLVFGQSYQGGSPVDPTAAVAALADDAEICGCNGVCKSTIISAIVEQDLTSIDAVRAHTKASSSCGTCSGLVQQLMHLTLGNDYQPAEVTPVCACTALGHDDIRHLIRTKGLKTVDAILQELEWTTSCGCAKCRPALNYYLVCEWPRDYEDDYQSRFINERAHANIQKNGTYSVVPRMWGGMTSSSELRAIADVVDKFNIPAVKVTGGQRIDMLGIEKDDLPLVWKDLGKAGFVSGHAYAKGLRTVKTCVGDTWCRFGTQDSTGLGIKLEKFLWGSWTPAKVKLAVSGCPRNCAEATCKDIGIICVDSGYEIHFAGAAGLDIKGTQVLGRVSTEQQVMEHCAALLQMYREQGHYLERIYKWAKRVGVDEIQQQIVNDAAKRTAYLNRFMESQAVAQVDPWQERYDGKFKGEFTPLTIQRSSSVSA